MKSFAFYLRLSAKSAGNALVMASRQNTDGRLLPREYATHPRNSKEVLFNEYI
jgi:hypothetical protein